jgi:hypothetical protein
VPFRPQGWGSEEVLVSWQDDDAQKLEQRLTDIAVHLILAAQINYRENSLYQYRVTISA